MATPRKPLGNAKRFAILQRDGFRCQYCGRTPPAAILHVDHIVPVADGGGNEDENLLASCSDCNHGKFTRAIEPERVPRDYKALTIETKERTRQLAAYREQMEELRAELERVIDVIGGYFWGSGFTWSHENHAQERAKVEYFLNLLGMAEVSDAARIAFSRLPDNGYGSRINQRFKYFCGVCWNRATALGIRGDSDAR